jgi:hypothetical protein
LPFFITATVGALLVISIACIFITSLPLGIGKTIRELAGCVLLVWICWLAVSILHFTISH